MTTQEAGLCHSSSVTLRSYGSPRSISGAIQKAEPTRDILRSGSLAGSSPTSLAKPKSVTTASLPRCVTRIKQFWMEGKHPFSHMDNKCNNTTQLAGSYLKIAMQVAAKTSQNGKVAFTIFCVQYILIFSRHSGAQVCNSTICPHEGSRISHAMSGL